MSTPENSPHWSAPERAQPLRHSLSLPGSKSLTNRELVLAALAEGPSTLRRPLHSRDTALMVEALRSLGAIITESPGEGSFGPDLAITPIPAGHDVSASIDCGLAGTVMRFVPPLAALVTGTLRFDGDIGARRRPMATTLHALTQLGLEVDDEGRDTLPFTITNTGTPAGSSVSIDASASSQFVSGLLLMAARLPGGLTVTHTGAHLPSQPHIEMTLSSLRARGVEVDSSTLGVWRVLPGPISALDVEIEPDLSNAAPFLAAPLITGGQVSIEGWPGETTQVGVDVPRILEDFGATYTVSGSTLTVDGGIGWRHGGDIPGVDLDLSHAGELAPTVIALAALASSPSVFRGIGHLRGHETDRLAALVENIRSLGGVAEETPDGIAVTPGPLDGGVWKAFADHRIATSGALLGLGVRGVVVDDISSTGKTLPRVPRTLGQPRGVLSTMIEDDLERYEGYEPRVRPSKSGSKPRSKNRPQHEDAKNGLVIAVDRGRYRVILDENTEQERLLTCTRARELHSQAIVTGDIVDVVGDTTGVEGSLARIVRIHPRQTVLRRSADDSDTFERIIVANAGQLLMVVAAASPEPRMRLVDRYLVAALDAGITPILCITKTDLASGEELRRYVHDAGVQVVERSPDNPARDDLVALLQDHITVAVGHSGVGKSTLVNDLVPGADRAVGDVNDVTGRGRHTSSSSQALRIPEGGWFIDTPGVRSFGLGHVSKTSIVEGFPELLPYTLECPKGCTHLEDSSECFLVRAIAEGTLTEQETARAQSLQRLMATLQVGAEHQSGSGS